MVSGGSPDAKVTVVVWQDYRCPVCKRMFLPTQQVLDRRERDLSAKVEYRAITLIDYTQSGHGSAMAANASLCAANAEAFDSYRTLLFRDQPDEQTDSYADPQKLIDLAKQIANLDTPAFESCVKTMPYAAAIRATQKEFDALDINGVPAYYINGTKWNPPVGVTDPQQVAAALDQAIMAAK